MRGWMRFVSMQDHYNLLYREAEREMLRLCQAEGIGVLPWSPLARGRLARAWEDRLNSERAATDEFGKTLYTAAEDADRKVVERVGEIAAARGIPRAQVALAWLLDKPFVTAPLSALPSRTTWTMPSLRFPSNSREEIASLEGAYVPHAVVGFS